MAEGNDGNYLQHSVEVAAADRLAAENRDALHIALAHGMAPFECFELQLDEKKSGLTRRYLKAALGQAAEAPRPNEPSIVTAYRNTCASEGHYPNSAELLRASRVRESRDGGGACGLSGGIVEICPIKHGELAKAWPQPCVEVACASWRSQICRGGALACPDDLQVPWLFTMDPMTYRAAGFCDDDKLYAADMDRLSKGLAPYLKSGQPGIALLFVYNVQRVQQCAFRQFAADLAGCIGANLCTYSLTHRGGNKNLAALLSPPCLSLPADFIADAVEEIEDVALAAAMQASQREFATREQIMGILEHDDGDADTTKLRARFKKNQRSGFAGED